MFLVFIGILLIGFYLVAWGGRPEPPPSLISAQTVGEMDQLFFWLAPQA
jgi:hypothetical protein